MSEEKFSPGPWFADWKNNPTFFPFVWQENGFAVAKMCGKPSAKLENTTIPVACLSDFADPEKVLANAALIAAAPEMYRKLEWLQREFDESDDEELVAIGWEIELILKKARGEE